MQITVPVDLRRELDAHRSKPGRRRNYPRHVKSAVVSWARSQLGNHTVRVLAASVDIGWDTLNRWLTDAGPVTTPSATTDELTPEPKFLPLRVAVPVEPSCSSETPVEVLVRGGRRVRVRWPTGANVLAEVVAALEAIP